MNKLDHIYQQEQFGEDWFSYPNLYSDIVKQFPSGSKFVEVGSWKGKSSAYMAVEIANSEKEIEFFCIDTWEGGPDHQGMEELSQLYETFLNNMKPVENYYSHLKTTSLEAVEKFEDNSLDFVFIDASHEYEDVKNDINAWLPKVKPGGILAGHDYYPEGSTDWFPGVKQAVNESLDNFELSDNCYIYRKKVVNKLKNFPPINFISITESERRRELLYKKFNQYELDNITPHVFERYDDSKHTFVGDSGKRLLGAGRGPTTSHLKAIKNWYFNTDEEYAFFCEDDLSLETVEYWNFTWEDFFNNLPSDWECVQLCWVRENIFNFSKDGLSLRPRCWCDWSACAYLMTRSHAKKLISNYYRDGDFNLECVGDDISLRPDWALRPTAETVVFSNLSPIYSFPLFVEDVNNCLSTFGNGIGIYNSSSYLDVINWWKNTGKDTPLSQIIK